MWLRVRETVGERDSGVRGGRKAGRNVATLPPPLPLLVFPFLQSFIPVSMLYLFISSLLCLPMQASIYCSLLMLEGGWNKTEAEQSWFSAQVFFFLFLHLPLLSLPSLISTLQCAASPEDNEIHPGEEEEKMRRLNANLSNAVL